MVSCEVKADAWVQYNGVCNWFTKRYKAHVGIKKVGQFGSECGKTTSNCYNVEEECIYRVCEDYFCVTWARAYAKINDQGNEVYEYGGFDGTNQWLAGSDATFKPLLSNLSPMIFFKLS